MLKPNVEIRPETDQGPWTEDQVRGVLHNPIYAGLGPYPAIVPDKDWIAVNIRLIKEEGPEQYLVNLLYVLRATFGQAPEGQPARSPSSVGDFFRGGTP